MGKNFTKKLSNLSKVPHPQGRKTAQMLKKAIRATGRQKVKLQHQMKVNILGEKLLWFKNNLDPVGSYTPELTLNLIERYLGRFNEELEQIKLKQEAGKRKGRQHANREDIINMTIKNERNEFLTCGIEMPNLLNQKQLALLRNWNEELRFLQNFKLVRYTKGKLESMKCSDKKDVKSVDVDNEDAKTEIQEASNDTLVNMDS